MTNLRAEKIRRIAEDIPEAVVEGPQSGKLLVLSWGGTFGAIYAARKELAEEDIQVSHCHLSYINPFPKNLGDILKRFDQILMPELNMGQLRLLIDSMFKETRTVGLNKVKGLPFKMFEIKDKIKELLK